MKKIAIVSVMMILGLSLLAQTSSPGRSVISGKVKLDSIITVQQQNDDQVVIETRKYRYNADGQVSYQYYNLNRSVTLPIEEEFYYEYLNDGKLTVTTILQKDAGTGEMINNEKIQTFFDDNGTIIKEEKDNWNTTTENWESVEKSEYFYNSNGNRKNGALYKIIDESNVLKLYRTDTIEYNTIDQVQSITTYQLSGNQLINFDRTKLTYDSDNSLLSRLYYKWVANYESWVIDKRYDYNYGSSSKSVVQSNWVYNLSDFVKNSKTDYLYNEQGDLIEYNRYSWDSSVEEWKKALKKEINLDYSYQPDEIKRPVCNYIEPQFDIYDECNPEGQFMDENIFDVTDGDWSLSETSTGYYSPFSPESVNETPNLKLIIYPNPAGEYIYISNSNKYASYAIITLSGQKLVYGKLTTNQIKVGSLTSGNYILKLINIKGGTIAGFFTKR